MGKGARSAGIHVLWGWPRTLPPHVAGDWSGSAMGQGWAGPVCCHYLCQGLGWECSELHGIELDSACYRAGLPPRADPGTSTLQRL